MVEANLSMSTDSLVVPLHHFIATVVGQSLEPFIASFRLPSRNTRGMRVQLFQFLQGSLLQQNAPSDGRTSLIGGALAGRASRSRFHACRTTCSPFWEPIESSQSYFSRAEDRKEHGTLPSQLQTVKDHHHLPTESFFRCRSIFFFVSLNKTQTKTPRTTTRTDILQTNEATLYFLQQCWYSINKSLFF